MLPKHPALRKMPHDPAHGFATWSVSNTSQRLRIHSAQMLFHKDLPVGNRWKSLEIAETEKRKTREECRSFAEESKAEKC
jgi:hypothetical protein